MTPDECIVCDAFEEFGPMFEEENGLYFFRAVTIDAEDEADFKNFPRKGPYKSKEELVSAFLGYLGELINQPTGCTHGK